MKGVAISYVIALAIGLIILAVGAYLIYKAMSEGSLECQECKAKFAAWCSTCYLSGWSGDTQLGQDLSECLDDCGLWASPAADKDCVGAAPYCAGVGVPL